MVGVIVTGHGHFPSGILSAVELVAGKPENVTGLDFEGGQSTDDLKRAMMAAVDGMEGDDILILADLAGGTPFNTAVMVCSEMADRNIRVIAGANLPALVEAVFSRGMYSFEALVPMVMEAGTAGVMDLESLSDAAQEPEFEDGL